MAGSPSYGGVANNINSIPFSAVERVEVLTDGGSALYGSDALAGVVNVIMRKDFEGAEAYVYQGSPERQVVNVRSWFHSWVNLRRW